MVRNTVQRTITLQAVQEMMNHPTAEEIFDKVRDRCPGISRATVYRVLAALADEGEVLRVPIANAPDRFDHTLYEHAHGICEKCGRVFDIIVEPFPHESKSKDFKVKRIDVVAEGICCECSENGTCAV